MATATQTVARPQVKQTQCFIDGQWVDAASGKTFETIHPATEEVIANVAEGDAADIDPRREGGPPGVRGGPLAHDGRGRPVQADSPPGRPDRGGAGVPRRARDPGQRQADLRLARGRPAAGDQHAALLRGVGRQNPRDHGPNPRRQLLLHPPRAGRRGRADHPVELPRGDGRVEMGPRARDRLHYR